MALQDRARNEPRDLYNIWYLVGGLHLQLEDLVAAVEQKWDFRGTNPALVRGDLTAKEARYRKLWEPRLSAQLAELPAFKEVYRLVRRAFRHTRLASGS